MSRFLRGEVWWADLAEPDGSGPGGTRPVVVIQANDFNQSRIKTVVLAIVSGNASLARAPGNVFIPAIESGLSEDSVVNVSQIITADKALLRDRQGRLSAETMKAIEHGVALVLGLHLME